VCDDYWSDTNAGVICRMLGYARGVGVSGSYFGTVGTMFGMDDVICTGSESSIMECFHQTSHNCGPREAAGVVCEEVTAVTTTARPATDDHKGGGILNGHNFSFFLLSYSCWWLFCN
jgi:hypothetical protein